MVHSMHQALAITEQIQGLHTLFHRKTLSSREPGKGKLLDGEGILHYVEPKPCT